MGQEEVDSIYGLAYIPTIDDDDRDAPGPNDRRRPSEEFSACNRAAMIRALAEVGDNCKMILEIGVYSNRGRGHAMGSSSTILLLDKRSNDCVYVGVDLANCGNVMRGRKNAYFIRCNSSEHEKVLDFVNRHGGGPIDFLHIDGYHSINQILRDWKYVEHLADHGVVVIHDSNVHPGPVELLKALDPELFEYERCCEEKNDWGIAIVRRKK